MAKNPKSLSVIVPCHQAETTIELCMTALTAARDQYRGRVEIIAVLSACTDRTEKLLARFTEVKIVRCGLGRARARNAGVKASSGDYVCFVDSDTIVAGGFLCSMADQLAKSKQIVGVACPIFPSAPQSQFLARMSRSVARYASGGTFISLFREMKLGQFVDTAACAFKRSAVRDLGGFDELLKRQEDVDFSLRARQGGGAFAWSPDTYALKIVNCTSGADYLRYAFNTGYERVHLEKRWSRASHRASRMFDTCKGMIGDLDDIRKMNCSRYPDKTFLALYFAASRLGNLFGIAINKN